jgi:hypothetical protein
MNCPRCNSKCQVADYSSIDKQIYYCMCGGTTELFWCNTYHDCDLIKFNIDTYTVCEPPLDFNYYDRVTLPSSFGPTHWSIAYQTNISAVLHRENKRISFKDAYKQLQRYHRLLVFS